MKLDAEEGKQQNDSAARPAGHHGATLLLEALSTQARIRGHDVNELATAIGVHPAHWYRLRAHPDLLARCDRSTYRSIADYLSWPFGRVLLACAAIGPRDFEYVLGGTEVVRSAIAQIEEGILGSGLSTPLEDAAKDHQLLIAEMYFTMQALAAKACRGTESK
jgi:hypothetical protein